MNLDENIIKSCCFLYKPLKGYRLIWEITSKCCFNCNFCFLPSKYQDLKTIQIIRLFDKIKKSGINIDEILLAGREIFMRNDMEEIIRHFKKNQVRISISTNGTLVKKIKRILSYRENIRSFNLSIYSYDRRINNQIYEVSAGNPNKKIEKSIDCISDAGIDIKVNIPLMEQTFNDLQKTVDYVANLGVRRISLMPLLPIRNNGNFKDNPSNILDLSNTNFYDILNDLSKKNNIEITPIRIKLLKSQNLLEVCDAGIKYLSILPNGTISPCNIAFYANPYNSHTLSYHANILDLRNYFEQQKTFFTNEDLRIKKILHGSNAINNEFGGGCRAVTISERGKNAKLTPFERFYDMNINRWENWPVKVA